MFARLLRQLGRGSPGRMEYQKEFWDAFAVKPFNNEENQQGFAGLLTRGSYKCVYKISKHEDNLIHHEYNVLRAIGELASWWPHFARAYGLVTYKASVNPKEGLRVGAKNVERQMLLLEYIPAIETLEYFILERETYIVVSLIKQVLLTIRLLRANRITHYDLHPQNVLVRACAPNLILRYRLVENGPIYEVPTYGYVAVIIDYGFAYAPPLKDEESCPLLCTLEHYPTGYMCDRFSPFRDYVQFYCSLAGHMKGVRDWGKLKLRRFLEDTFKGCDVDKDCGWDKDSRAAPPRLLIDKVAAGSGRGKMFKKDDWVHSLQMLIEAPIERIPEATELSAFEEFSAEWLKIEERVTDIHVLNYLFKKFVQVARAWREPFFNEPHEIERAKIVDVVKIEFELFFNQVVKYFAPAINIETMLCSLYLMAQYAENSFAESIQRKLAKKEEQFKRLPMNEDSCDDALWVAFCKNFGGYVDVLEPEYMLVAAPN